MGDRKPATRRSCVIPGSNRTMLGSREVHGRHCLWCISVTLALLVVLCNGASVFSKISVCPRPPAPKHGGFVCSYGCWPVLDGMQFFAGSEVEYYCDGGYTLSAPVISARCSQGKWSPVANVLCRPSPGYTDAHPPAPVPGTSISLVAAVAATVAGLLLMAMVCVLVKPKSRSCQCGQDYSRMQEPHLQSEVWHPSRRRSCTAKHSRRPLARNCLAQHWRLHSTTIL